MSDFIALIAKKVGWKTWYHVTYQFQTLSGSIATGDMTLSIRPWLRRGETFSDLRNFLKEQSDKHNGAVTPNIISITRIGG